MVETAVRCPGLVRAGHSRGAISTRLVAVWSVLAVLVAGIVAIGLSDRAAMQVEDAAAGSKRDPRLLVPVALGEVGAIEVAHAGAIHRFERDAAGAWFYHGVHVSANAAHVHRADPVMAQRIETAFQGFERTRMERKLEGGQAIQQYGLATPQMVILVYRPNELQPLLQVAVGDVAPDTYSRYVMVVGTASVVTIANYQIDNLLNLIKAAAESGQGQATTSAG